MPILVHLTTPDDARIIRGRGQRARPFPDGARGVFCMPLLPDEWVSHQWLRELKRKGGRTLVAVHVRLGDEERVLVGHYAARHVETTLGAAIGVMRAAADARGYELIVPRSIESAAIRGVRALADLRRQRRGDADALVPLADHESPSVREDVAATLASFRSEIAIALLVMLAGDPEALVREAAVISLVTIAHERVSELVRDSVHADVAEILARELSKRAHLE